MILNELIDGVRYPDEVDGLYFDATPYNRVVEYLKFVASSAKGQLKIDHEQTLKELERRWEERQAKSKRTVKSDSGILTKKVVL